MSNDPNRRVQQDRNVYENRTHNTMETVKLERGLAKLPAWQRLLIYGAGLAVVVIVLLLVFV